MLIRAKTIMFDWGGTLARVATQDQTRRPCAEAAAAFLRDQGYALPDGGADELLVRFVETSARTEQTDCLEELDSDRLLAEWMAACRMKPLTGEGATALRVAFWTPWVGCLELFDGVADVLRGLRGAGYGVGLVSNCAADVSACHAEIRRQGIAELLGFSFFTSELGKRKPHESVYAEAFRRAAKCLPDLRANDVLFVGDTPMADVEGPKRFGMKTALVGTGNWSGDENELREKPDAILDSVRDLPANLLKEAATIN